MKNENLNQPLVSIVIPVYNGEAYIEQTIESVIKTTYKNYEIILVNDASTDNSDQICRSLSKKYEQIRYYSFRKNKGLAELLNFAIQKAYGEFIARINQDDIMMTERLAKQVEFFQTHPEHVAVGSNIELFNDQGGIVDTIVFPASDEELKKKWMFLSPFSDPSVMYRKSAFLQTKGYQSRFWPVDDVHMWYQLGQVGKLANIQEILTRVRWHDNAGSIKSHRQQMQRLFELHVWASKNIQKAPLSAWIFWSGQYIAGILFPPRFNWYVLRLIRKIQNMR